MSYVEVHTTACHSGMDGDCSWSECPQEANNRANYQSYCPLARQPVEPWVRSDAPGRAAPGGRRTDTMTTFEVPDRDVKP